MDERAKRERAESGRTRPRSESGGHGGSGKTAVGRVDPRKVTAVTRGEEFLGLQMSLLVPAEPKKGRRKAAPEEAPPEAKPKHLTHLLCPRCGRYLGGVLPGASALCPRCGVWAAEVK